MMWNSVDNALINACVIINPAQVGEVPWHRFGWEVGVLGRMEELRRKEKNCELWRIAKNCELCGRRIGVVTLVAPLSDCWEGTLCDNCWTLCDSVTHCHTHHWPQTLNVLLIREGVRKKNPEKVWSFAKPLFWGLKKGQKWPKNGQTFSGFFLCTLP